MEITNGDVQVELPEALAKLLIENRGWQAGRRGRSGRSSGRSGGSARGVEEAPIPMTHIPGVVPGVSMKKVRALVAAGAVPVVLKDRTKLIRPSDVRAALEGAGQ